MILCFWNHTIFYSVTFLAILVTFSKHFVWYKNNFSVISWFLWYSRVISWWFLFVIFLWFHGGVPRKIKWLTIAKSNLLYISFIFVLVVVAQLTTCELTEFLQLFVPSVSPEGCCFSVAGHSDKWGTVSWTEAVESELLLVVVACTVVFFVFNPP